MLKCSGTILAHCNSVSWFKQFSTSASLIAGITGMYHHVQLIVFEFLVEMGFYYVDQAGLEILT